MTSEQSLDLDILRALNGQALDMRGLVERIGVHRGLVRIAQSCESLQLRGLIFLDTGARAPSPSPSWKLTVTGRLELKKEGGADRVASS